MLRRKNWPSAVMLISALLLLQFGCVSANTAKNVANGDEQVYIDLKHQFSLIIPTTWTRVPSTVSSPSYRPDTVKWLIPGGHYLSIKSVRQFGDSTLQKTLRDAIQQNGGNPSIDPLNFQHPAGNALRQDIEEKSGSTIYLVISGHHHIYLLTCRIDALDDPQIKSNIENIIATFSIIAD